MAKKMKKSSIKVAVVGSRSIVNCNYVYSALDYYLSRLLKENEVTIVSGGASGIDLIAEHYARDRGLKTEIYRPEYNLYPAKVAPIIRNEQIVKTSDYLIAITTGSNGTASAIKMAEKKGIPIKIVKYETHNKTK